jgi:hypothetical protein
MLTYADVCVRMLTYADVCVLKRRAPLEAQALETSSSTN